MTDVKVVAVITLRTPIDHTDVIAALHASKNRFFNLSGAAALTTLSPDGETVIEGDILSVNVQSVDVQSAP